MSKQTARTKTTRRRKQGRRRRRTQEKQNFLMHIDFNDYVATREKNDMYVRRKSDDPKKVKVF